MKRLALAVLVLLSSVGAHALNNPLIYSEVLDSGNVVEKEMICSKVAGQDEYRCVEAKPKQVKKDHIPMKWMILSTIGSILITVFFIILIGRR